MIVKRFDLGIIINLQVFKPPSPGIRKSGFFDAVSLSVRMREIWGLEVSAPTFFFLQKLLVCANQPMKPNLRVISIQYILNM
jgi:hypothetical protein